MEIFFSWTVGEETFAHAVTLTSLKFEDDNTNGQWDSATEDAWVDYVDPNDPTKRTWSEVSVGANGLHLTYGAHDAWVYGAFSESPVPLPPAA